MFVCVMTTPKVFVFRKSGKRAKVVRLGRIRLNNVAPGVCDQRDINVLEFGIFQREFLI